MINKLLSPKAIVTGLVTLTLGMSSVLPSCTKAPYCIDNKDCVGVMYQDQKANNCYQGSCVTQEYLNNQDAGNKD